MKPIDIRPLATAAPQPSFVPYPSTAAAPTPAQAHPAPHQPCPPGGRVQRSSTLDTFNRRFAGRLSPTTGETKRTSGQAQLPPRQAGPARPRLGDQSSPKLPMVVQLDAEQVWQPDDLALLEDFSPEHNQTIEALLPDVGPDDPVSQGFPAAAIEPLPLLADLYERQFGHVQQAQEMAFLNDFSPDESPSFTDIDSHTNCDQSSTSVSDFSATQVPWPSVRDSESPTPGTSPAELKEIRLHTLGYTSRQVKAMKPSSRGAVIGHHQSLIEQGFSRDQIVKTSWRTHCLKFLAEKSMALMEALPGLQHETLANLIQGRTGVQALQNLLELADDLRAEPLWLSTAQLVHITKSGGSPALHTVHTIGKELCSAPYELTGTQVVDLASTLGGSKKLTVVKSTLPVLTEKPYELSRDMVLAIARKKAGARKLLTLQTAWPVLTDLRQPSPLTRDQMVAIANDVNAERILGELLNSLTK